MAELRQGDYVQQLADYIKKNLAKGYTTDSLRIALENRDYSRSAIERAIKLANEQLAKQAPALKEKPVIKYEVIDKVQVEPEKGFWNRIKKLFS